MTPTKTENVVGTQLQNITGSVEDLPMHVVDKGPVSSIIVSADGSLFIDKDYVITQDNLTLVLKEIQTLNYKIQSGTASDFETQKVRHLSLKIYEQMHSDNVALYATPYCNDPSRLEKSNSDVKKQINLSNRVPASRGIHQTKENN